MSEEKRLLPCPFCGGEGKLKEISGRWTVHCANQCAGTRIFNGKARPIEAWNKRTPDIVYCRECVMFKEYENTENIINFDETEKDRGYCRCYARTMWCNDYCSNGKRKEQEDEDIR